VSDQRLHCGGRHRSRDHQEDGGGKTPLEVVDSSLLSLTTSLPLAQFGAVHKGAPTQTFEQDINE
jgi:hypothetical protein